MRTILFGAIVTMALAPLASGSLVVNGSFDSGLSGWTTSGFVQLYNAGSFSLPNSPSGQPFSGAVTNYGGNLSAPLGSISQIMNFTGPMTVSGELFAAAKDTVSTKTVSIEVLWNGAVVESIVANPVGNLNVATVPWQTFEVPVVGTGSNTLKVQWWMNFAQWSYTSVDNLVVTPEPFTLLILAVAGLPLLRRRRP